MKLYHGTSSRYLKKILKNGLLPRTVTNNSNWDTMSGDDRVYLTTAYAPYYAIQSCKRKSDKPIIVEIDTNDLDMLNLIPDEDYMEQVSRGHDDLDDRMSMEERTELYRDNAFAIALKHPFIFSAMTSLDGLGTCAHFGAIPSDAISRIIQIDHIIAPDLAMIFLDPTITIANYRYVGNKYRWLTALVSGNVPDTDDAPTALPEMFWEDGEIRYDYPKSLEPHHLRAIKVLFDRDA